MLRKYDARLGGIPPFQSSTLKVKFKKFWCWKFDNLLQFSGYIHAHTPISPRNTPPPCLCTHTHTRTHKKNFVLLFWPPPLLVFILICMRGVHRGGSRAYWSCASSIKHTWTCKTTGTHKQHGAEWGTRQRGGWTHQHFKWSNGWEKKGFDIKNPSSSQNSEQNKRTKQK